MKLAFWKQRKTEEVDGDQPAAKTGPKIRVLMVDDETAFTRMTRRHLEAAGGFIVETVAQARATIGAARAFKPHVILLDVMMPDGDGGEVAAALAAEDDLCHIPIMFLTAAIKGNEVGKKGAGFIGGRLYIAKPVEPNTLIGLLQENALAV